MDDFQEAGHISRNGLNAIPTGSVPFHRLSIAHDDLIDSCKTVLKKVFPTWDIESDVHCEQCKDGITNKLVKCGNKTLRETVLIRVYGKKSELLINRVAELENFITLNAVGLSPPLHARFENGFIYGFAEGRPLKVFEMPKPHYMVLIARKLARWHKVQLPGRPTIKKAKLFPTLWKWWHSIPKEYASPDIQKKFAKFVNVQRLERELKSLEGLLSSLESPVVFCHNDLLNGNIIISPGDDSISFIDFEYAGYNYRGFDLGNHFCEFAGFECDYSHYPDRATQLVWLEAYWQESYGSTPNTEELEEFYWEANTFALAAHFYWGLWGLIQASFSDIPFDYMSYAISRFNQYFLTKDTWWKRPPPSQHRMGMHTTP